MVDDLTTRLGDSSGRSLSVSAWPSGYGELRQDESHDGPQHGATPEQAGRSIGETIAFEL